MPLGTIAAIVGIGAGGLSIGNALFGGQGGGGQGFNPLGLPGAPEAAHDYLTLLRQMYDPVSSIYGTVSPQLQQAYQTSVNAPYGGLTSAANQASGMYPAISAADLSAALQMAGMANQMQGAGTGILATGFDPQQDLYKRTLQQVQDQSRAAQSVRGIAESPYGAGLENQATSNFNIDWQNQQLARQAQAIQGAGQANQLAGADLTSMLQMFGQAPQNILQGGQLPVSTQNQIAQYLNQAAGNYAGGVGSALAPMASLQSQIFPYLGLSQGAGQSAFGAYANNRDFAAQQALMGSQGFFQGLNAFAGTPSGQGVNNWLGGLFGTSGGNNPNPMANVGGSGSVNTVPYGGFPDISTPIGF